jgi:hypothetical protein
MLQLPSSESAVTTLRQDQDDCPLVKLASQFEAVNRAYNRADKKNSEIDKKHFSTELDNIAERASHLTPRSADGAAFMVMLAHDIKGCIEYGASEEIKERASARQDRLHYRLLEFLGGGSLFPEVREYLMDAAFDPAVERRPASAFTSEGLHS